MAGEGTIDVDAELEPLTDAELTAAALAADPDTVVPDDGVSLWDIATPVGPTLLPAWYMPAPMGAPKLRGWRRGLARCGALAVIASFVVINAYGLCNTYGQLHF